MPIWFNQTGTGQTCTGTTYSQPDTIWWISQTGSVTTNITPITTGSWQQYEWAGVDVVAQAQYQQQAMAAHRTYQEQQGYQPLQAQGMSYGEVIQQGREALAAQSTVIHQRAIPGGGFEVHERRNRRIIAARPKDAEDKARELLLMNLTDEQRRTFVENKWFVVKGGKSGKSYRIRDVGHVVANIDALHEQTPFVNGVAFVTHKLCAHPDTHVYPHCDHLLSQKVMLELAEDDFLRVANRHAA